VNSLNGTATDGRIFGRKPFTETAKNTKEHNGMLLRARPPWDMYRRSCGYTQFPDETPGISFDAANLMFVCLAGRRRSLDDAVNDETWKDLRSTGGTRLSKQRFRILLRELQMAGYIKGDRISEKWKQRLIKQWKTEALENSDRFDASTGHFPNNPANKCYCETCESRRAIMMRRSDAFSQLSVPDELLAADKESPLR
jgi:hypothetical protein